MTTKNPAIRIENISKCYPLGVKEKMHDSIGSALLDFLKSPLKNYRYYRSLYSFHDLQPGSQAGRGDIIWALKDISFEMEHGQIMGIIGRNGAGKSTLLKILSKIVDPTSGRAEVYGRTSSLLEVGTGFHPDLTGRENVYLNATLLGMRKKEVDRKFDEIVDFSEATTNWNAVSGWTNSNDSNADVYPATYSMMLTSPILLCAFISF